MRAVWLTRFGGPEVLVPGDAPEPAAGPGQVVIDVAFANITFVETQVRVGRPGPFRPETPTILGNGVGGVVAAVGADVDPALVGGRVISSTGGSGGYAERVAVAADGVVTVPDTVGLDVAVALLADGRTAHMLLDAVPPRPGDRVLVEAAAGGVGSLLLQLARAADARVVAAAGGARKLAAVARFGPTLAVDYRRPGWDDEVRTALGGLDVVLDGVGGTVAAQAFDLLGSGGRMVSFGAASGTPAGIEPERAAARGVQLVGVRADPARLRGFVERALADAEAGRLQPVIGQRFALDRAADAHAAIEARDTIGKTLLEVRR